MMDTRPGPGRGLEKLTAPPGPLVFQSGKGVQGAVRGY
jgi:hypothetical protein